jgi:hypothetical protein
LRTTKTLRYISHQIILRRLLWKKWDNVEKSVLRRTFQQKTKK